MPVLPLLATLAHWMGEGLGVRVLEWAGERAGVREDVSFCYSPDGTFPTPAPAPGKDRSADRRKPTALARLAVPPATPHRARPVAAGGNWAPTFLPSIRRV